ncbi:hypothetical protein HY772_03460, partial [Candidatus Woesearchaeota archaeon]|nr:hypothetical protein [Candidatus Woesearchaeota archaeon]
GTTTVTACDGSPQGVAETTFKIKANVYEVSPTRGTVGTSVIVRGNGYTEYEGLDIRFGNTQHSAGTTLTELSGIFTIVFTVNQQIYGTKAISVIGVKSTEQQDRPFIILPSIPSVTPVSGTVGTKVTICLDGFDANDVIRVEFGKASSITFATTNINGTLSTIFTVNTQPCGTTTITAYGTTATSAGNVFVIMPQIIEFTPISGTVGSTVSIAGDGYGDAETIRIKFGDNNNIQTTIASSEGSFSTTFIVDTQAAGLTTAIAIGSSSGRQVERTYQIQPNIIGIMQTQGTVGTSVTVQGNGFGKAAAIRVEFGVNATITTTTAATNGSFTAIFTVDTQVWGTTTITGYDGTTSASGTFTILPNFYAYMPKSGTVGTPVIVSGNGFGGNEAIRITFGANTTITSVTTDGSGSFTSSFTVDLQPYGTRTVQATGLTSGQIFRDVFDISSVITNMTPTIASVTTVITILGNGFGANIATGINSGRSDSRLLKLVARMWQVSPDTGTVGTRVTIYGDGYSDAELIVVHFGILGTMTTTSSILTSNNGTYSAVFYINTQVSGTTTVKATGYGTNKSNQVTENTFWISSHITGVLPATGPVGTMVTLTGDGYGNNESVRIAFGINQTITTVTTGQYGTFSTIFTIDTQTIGTTTIVAKGILISDDDIFVIRTGIATIVPAAGTVGTGVTITGGGYAANETVSIDFGLTTGINSCKADNNGWITGTFTVNEQSYGDKVVKATGAQSGSFGTISFRITQNLVFVTPDSGTVGTTITAYGNGYTPGSMTIKFGLPQNEGGRVVFGEAGENGTYSISFGINTQVYGTTTVDAVDSKGYNDIEYIRIISHITHVLPATGSVGTLVTVRGDGYGASEAIRILLGNTPTIATTMSSKWGSFSVSFTVNVQACGTVSVIAYGNNNEALHQDDDVFRIRGEITLVSPTQGTVGTPITINGNGYGANETVRIDFGLAEGITNATVQNNGVFSAVFTIDTQVYGTKTLTVTGTNTGDVDYRKVKVTPEVVWVSPTSGTIGTIITIYGTGYKGTITNISIDFGTEGDVGHNADLITLIETSERGTFTGYINNTIGQSYGSTTITAYCSNEPAIFATNIFKILPEVWSVKPTQGTVGTRVTVDGTGYMAGDKINIQFGNTPTITTGTILINGSFTVEFTVDTQAFGTTTIRGYGSNMADDSSNVFKILPKIYRVSPTTGTVGSDVTIYGDGYGAGETVTVTFGSRTFTQVYTTDNVGRLQAGFTVDIQQYGAKTIEGVGNTTQWAATNTYFIIPSIYSVLPSEGTIGTVMTISGHGYSPIRRVAIDFGTRPGVDASRIVETTEISGAGTFSYSYTPESGYPQSAGTTNIVAWGMTGETIERATNTFFIKSRILTFTPAQATVGSTISIFGDGYSANYTVRIGFGNVTTIASQTTSDSGTFSRTFVVNTQYYGTTTITAACSINTASNTVVILPNIISVAPAIGTVGSSVTVRGNGYSPSGQVRLEFGTTGTITTTTAANNGSWTAMFTVDTQGYGTTSITAWDNVGGMSAATSTYRILPNIINVQPKSGTVGSSVLVSGNGYTNSNEVRLTFGDNGTIATTTAEVNGSFTCSFVIDTQAYGTTSITGTGAGNEAAGTYTYRVLPNIISVYPQSGTVGSSVTVSGNGYGTGKAIRLVFGNNATINWTTTAANGSFTTVFAVDTQSYGTKTITGYDGDNQINAGTYTYCITPNIISITPQEGSVGTMVMVRGNGFGGSHTIRMAFGLNPTITYVSSAGNGSFTAVFTVDTQAFGTTTVTACDGSPQGVAETTFKIKANVY